MNASKSAPGPKNGDISVVRVPSLSESWCHNPQEQFYRYSGLSGTSAPVFSKPSDSSERSSLDSRYRQAARHVGVHRTLQYENINSEHNRPSHTSRVYVTNNAMDTGERNTPGHRTEFHQSDRPEARMFVDQTTMDIHGSLFLESLSDVDQPIIRDASPQYVVHATKLNTDDYLPQWYNSTLPK